MCVRACVCVYRYMYVYVSEQQFLRSNNTEGTHKHFNTDWSESSLHAQAWCWRASQCARTFAVVREICHLKYSARTRLYFSFTLCFVAHSPDPIVYHSSVAALDIVHAMIDKHVSTNSKSSRCDQKWQPARRYLRHLEPIHMPSPSGSVWSRLMVRILVMPCLLGTSHAWLHHGFSVTVT